MPEEPAEAGLPKSTTAMGSSAGPSVDATPDKPAAQAMPTGSTRARQRLFPDASGSAQAGMNQLAPSSSSSGSGDTAAQAAVAAVGAAAGGAPALGGQGSGDSTATVLQMTGAAGPAAPPAQAAGVAAGSLAGMPGCAAPQAITFEQQQQQQQQARVQAEQMAPSPLLQRAPVPRVAAGTWLRRRHLIHQICRPLGPARAAAAVRAASSHLRRVRARTAASTGAAQQQAPGAQAAAAAPAAAAAVAPAGALAAQMPDVEGADEGEFGILQQVLFAVMYRVNPAFVQQHGPQESWEMATALLPALLPLQQHNSVAVQDAAVWWLPFLPDPAAAAAAAGLALAAPDGPAPLSPAAMQALQLLAVLACQAVAREHGVSAAPALTAALHASLAAAAVAAGEGPGLAADVAILQAAVGDNAEPAIQRGLLAVCEALLRQRLPGLLQGEADLHSMAAALLRQLQDSGVLAQHGQLSLLVAAGLLVEHLQPGYAAQLGLGWLMAAGRLARSWAPAGAAVRQLAVSVLALLKVATSHMPSLTWGQVAETLLGGDRALLPGAPASFLRLPLQQQVAPADWVWPADLAAVDGQTYFLGKYPTQEEARRAVLSMAVALTADGRFDMSTLQQDNAVILELTPSMQLLNDQYLRRLLW